MAKIKNEKIIEWLEQEVAVADLQDFDRNPRKISAESFNRLVDDIRTNGYHQRIIATPDLRVIGGHQRKKALIELGIETIRVLVPDREISDEKFREMLVKDNLPFGEFDFGILEQDYDFDELVGYGMPEDWLKCFDVAPTEGLTDEDAIPEPPAEPISVLGDLWLLGNHRLMCGDSTSIDAVEKLMGGGKADMVFTDPPYRMDAEGGSNQPIGRAAAKLGEAIKHLCDFDPVAFLEVLPTVFNKNTMNSFVFCNKDLVPDYLNWGVQSGYSFNILFWKKPNAIPLGGQHRPDTEYLLYFRKGAIWNNALKDANYSKCLEFNRENSTPHPTMKPVGMIENQIKISSNEDSPILDLFGGSGSTLIACEKTNRHARLMELDPKYCDVIVKRWEDFTGREAVHAETGERFNSRV